MGPESISRHPADRLIRELLEPGRAAGPDEIAQIVARLAAAPFSPRLVSVAIELQGLVYQGRLIYAREPALFAHLVQRVIADRQWAVGTTEQQYLGTLRRAVRSASARLLMYERRGGILAAALARTRQAVPPRQRGARFLPWLYVVYSADRGTIISGYQASGLEELNIPGNARWLK
ncbi:MAG TPA: hypothetical protein VFE37_28815 [Chloroflexota bacterium]|nr:hypothetical protein [Chloroflexota bacterium]